MDTIELESTAEIAAKRHPRAYVAGSLKDIGAVRVIQELCRSSGYVISYDWTTHGYIEEAPGQTRRRSITARREMRAVEEADVVVFVAPGGRGTHVEFGAALALNKPIILYAPNASDLLGSDGFECMFYHHPNVTRVLLSNDILDVLEWLR